MNTSRLWLLIGIINALLAVVLAAMGAHGPMAPATPKLQQILSTASLFHLIHSLALIQFGFWITQNPTKSNWPANLLLVGMILFVGTLYLLAFTTVKFPGVLTPIGGLLIMLGWLAWGWQVLFSEKP